MGLKILARMIAKSVLNGENPVAIDEDKSQNAEPNDSPDCWRFQYKNIIVINSIRTVVTSP